MEQAIEFLITKDAVLGKIIETYGKPVVQKRNQGFDAMVHIILEQQVSIASAKACYLKMQGALGTITPETISQTTDETLRSCGVSRQKTIYIRDLAEKVLRNELDFESLATKNEVEVRNELLAIKGVGNWTVEVYLMFCLQHPDIIPIGDIALRNTIIELYQIHDPNEMEILAQNWAPHRSLASFILWHHYLGKRNRL